MQHPWFWSAAVVTGDTSGIVASLHCLAMEGVTDFSASSPSILMERGENKLFFTPRRIFLKYYSI